MLRFQCAGVLLATLLSNQVAQGSECIKTKTALDGASFLCSESPVGVCSDGILASGILKGTKTAIYTAAAEAAGLWTESPFVLSYSADAVFTTKRGDLYLNQLGVADTERRVFTELNRVVGGTGRFEEATGNLVISGTQNTSDLATEFESEVSGTICLSRPIDDD